MSCCMGGHLRSVGVYAAQDSRQNVRPIAARRLLHDGLCQNATERHVSVRTAGWLRSAPSLPASPRPPMARLRRGDCRHGES